MKWVFEWVISLAVVGVIVALLGLAFMVFILPPGIDDEMKAQFDSQVENFKSIDHPKNTKQVYFSSFLGHADNSDNIYEIVIEARKYDGELESEIAQYYETYYSHISLRFINSSNDCCGGELSGFVPLCASHVYAEDQPIISDLDCLNDLLPIYELTIFKTVSTKSYWWQSDESPSE